MRTVLACWIALGLIFVLTQRPVRTAFASESDAVIQLRTYDYARAGSLTIEKAQKRVSFVFNRVGINTQWVSLSAAHCDTNWYIALSSYAAAPAKSLPSGKSLRRTSGSVLEQVKEECYSQGGVRR